MADLYPVAGCRLFICGPVDVGNEDLVASDFPALDSEDWIEIDGWSQMGAFGDAAALMTTSLINRGRDIKQKGTANAGSMQNVFAVMDDDPGQIALLAAANPSDKRNYGLRVQLNDQPATPTGLPSQRLFAGVVMSAQEQGGEANTVRNLNGMVEINSNIVRVAAS